MRGKKYHHRADIRRLQEKLEISQRQLYELENSRTLRTYHYFRRSLLNPFWGVRNIGQIPGLLSKIEFPETLGEAGSYRPSLPGDENGSYMPYPNLKVASIGVVPDMAIYCHHLLTEGSEWHRLLERGIDALLVGDLTGYSKEQYGRIIKQFKNAGVPIFRLHPETKISGVKAQVLKNYLVVDLSHYNPIGIPDNQYAKPIGNFSPDKQKLYNCSAVEIQPRDFAHEYQHSLAVLSALSCGIPAITPKTNLLEKLLPSDFPYIENQEQQATLLERLSKDDFAWKRYSVKYRRYVHLNYSPRKLADEIAGKAGFKTVEYDPKISIILSTRRPDLVDAALENAKKQTHNNKELLLVLHGEGFDTKKIKTQTNKLKFPVIVIEKTSNTLFGDNLNAALDAATGDYVTKMDDDDYYGPHCFEDLLAAYEYSRATAVGKRTNITYLTNSDTVVTFAGRHEEKFGPHLPGHSFLMRTEIIRSLRFGRVKRAIDSEMWRRLETRGGTLYSTHCLNFIRVRHGDKHTYEIEDEDFIANSTTKPTNGLDTDKYYV